MHFCLTLFLTPFLVWSNAAAELLTVVNTPLGPVQGHIMTSRGGRKFLAFSGLPYAKPPIGQLRFEPPQEVEPWTSLFNATEDGPLCLQLDIFDDNSPDPIGVENCLYLSLYTHDVKRKAAVLVHLHGGSFIAGNGPRYTGPEYLMDEDVVVVDINYRLGMFGFLSFEDKDMPGNQGMKDQVMALRWVQKNIRSFGGDPRKVTLVGESSGGSSVYHHTVSPLSKGLFHAGIAESGTSYMPIGVSVPGTARNASMYLLSLMGCNYTTTRDAVECLKTKDANEIASKSENYRTTDVDFSYLFIPVLEPPGPGSFLTGPIKDWKHNPVPLIIGTTSAEALLRTLYLPYSIEYFSDNFDRVALESLQIEHSASNPQQVIKAVHDFYFPNKRITSNDFVNLTMMYSDTYFTAGILDGAYNHSGNVYFYLFDYLGNESFAGNADTRNKSLVFGAFHADEVIYLWNFRPAQFSPLKGKDLEVSKKLVKLWVDFAKYGKPTLHQDDSNFFWDKWTIRKQCYAYISNNGFKMEQGFAEERYKFWKSLNYRDNYDRYYQDMFC